MSAHIRIDWTRCDGHGVCAALLPDRIRLDEWGFPIVGLPVVRDANDPAVRSAAAACPALALYLDKTP